MHLIILTPGKKIFEGSVQKVTLPGSAGLFQLLENHAPLVSLLQQGTIFYESEQQASELVIEEGFVEVENNNVVILVKSLSN